MSVYEDRPTILKILHSTDNDHLRMLSEIPRRMVSDIVNADVLVVLRKNLVRHLLDKARRLQQREQARIQEIEAELEDLEDNVESDDESDEESELETARTKLLHALPKISKSEQYLEIAHVHLMKLQNQSSIIETWMRSFLLVMRGVDRKGVEEVLNAYVAAASDEDEGEELDRDF